MGGRERQGWLIPFVVGCWLAGLAAGYGLVWWGPTIAGPWLVVAGAGITLFTGSLGLAVWDLARWWRQGADS